ncbi:MAG: serine hydrolase domain-containing protein [Candidatus Latescibacterota bacterium]
MVSRTCILSIILSLALISIPCADSLPKANPEEPGLSAPRIERIDRALHSWVAEGKIAGAVTLIARHGKIAHAGAYGSRDQESDDLMREDAIFAIMSMTKPITSLATLMLYEEGKFLLTDPVSKYIPEFANMRVILPGQENSDSPATEPAKSPITIRHLLLHTAGLSYGSGAHAKLYRNAGLGDWSAPERTAKEMTLALAKLPLLFHPGEKYTYSLSDDVLGYFIEVVSGMPFDRFLEERIFLPLGMKDTFFYVPDAKKNRVAAVYRTTGKGLEKLPPSKKLTVSPSEQRFFSGGGGLYSTVQDYARFCQMLLNKGELGGVRLVSRKTVEMMTVNGIGDIDPGLPEGGDKWGLGGVSVRTKYFPQADILSPGCYMKSGAYSTQFWVDPAEDMFGIFLVQLQPLNVDLIHAFMTLGTQAIGD